jgi:hypothetical protein
MAWQAMFGNGQATAMLRMLTGNSGGTYDRVTAFVTDECISTKSSTITQGYFARKETR